jgi:hypothetical protein
MKKRSVKSQKSKMDPEIGSVFFLIVYQKRRVKEKRGTRYLGSSTKRHIRQVERKKEQATGVMKVEFYFSWAERRREILN